MRSVFALLGVADVDPDAALALEPKLSLVPKGTIEQLRNDALYHQYTDRQQKDAQALRADEAVQLPDWMDYENISGLSGELRSKLQQARPQTLAAAAKIEGMTPAALTLILAIARSGRRREA